MFSTIKRRTMAISAAALATGGGLALAVATGSGANAQSQYTIPLHQSTPITAAGYDSQEKSCDGIPATKDGWHFVLPGNSTRFVKLTVTFDPGGTQTITAFGPPTAKHAYVSSVAGAELTSASAVVKAKEGAKKLDWFNLSHTCPASSTPTSSPTTTPSMTPSESPSESPSGTPSSQPSRTPTVRPSGTPSASPTTGRPAPTPSPVGTGLPVTG